MPTITFPSPIQTERLVLRAWHASDAPALKEALDSSLAHLQEWLPWARAEPSPIEVLEERLRSFATAFAEGRDGMYGIFPRDESTVLGGAGLHPRIEAGGLEIGYWLRKDAVGRGYVTEAVRALMAAAFEMPAIRLVEIRCDSRNVRSAAVPRRLGFVHVCTIDGPTPEASGERRTTLVWRATANRKG